MPALVAFLIGTVMLAAWFRAYWPATTWTVVPRAQLIEQGRQVAQHFGFNVNGWKAYLVATVSNSLTHYGRHVSPLSLRISYISPLGDHAVEVGFDSAGTVLYWRAPKEIKSPQQFASDEAAAQSAFQFLAASQAASYAPPTRFAGDESHEQNYEFRKTPQPSSDLRERIKVTTKDSTVERVERKIYLASAADDDDDNENAPAGVLSALLVSIVIVSAVIIIGIYILWRVRKAVNHRFPLRLAAFFFIFMLASVVIGGSDKRKSPNLEHDTPIVPQVFVAACLGCFVAVGRGISPAARPKWMSLEQLCLLAPISRSTGQSLAAGLLFGPLLAALPFLVVATRLFPDSWLLARNADLLYSRAPLLDSSKIGIYLLLFGFFGFGFPALERLIRSRWLRWLIVIPAGTVVFSSSNRMVEGPLLALLAVGLLTLALYWFAWASFDLLAILTLQLAGTLIFSLLILLQKGENIWTFLVALALIAGVAVYCYLRGQPIPEGDPLATHPMLTGFRAEREKLRAEFSVARRAQMDMLPQSPPDIPGYSIAASCTPSLEVGGDLYDFFRLPDGRIGIGVADVSGKGVPAALYMTLTKGLLASVTKSSSDIAPVIEEVNRHLHGVTRKKVFVTMVLGFLDAKNQILQCVRAGHNPVVWRQKSRNLTTLVSPGGLGLGITAGKVFKAQLKVEEMHLSHGDAVVFYSDGITEAMNRALEQFGEQRLMDAVGRTDSMDAAAAHDSILTEVRDFLDGVHPQDDMTLVVLRVGKEAE